MNTQQYSIENEVPNTAKIRIIVSVIVARNLKFQLPRSCIAFNCTNPLLQ